MAYPDRDGLTEIQNRNLLREEAGLPLLDMQAEARRLQSARDQAEFEREWEKRRPEFAGWIAEGDGWLAKMGRFSIARQQVRREMPNRRD